MFAYVEIVVWFDASHSLMQLCTNALDFGAECRLFVPLGTLLEDSLLFVDPCSYIVVSDETLNITQFVAEIYLH